MKYYCASLFYRSDHEPPISDENTIWEEKIILIKADDEFTAMKIAERCGVEGCHGYRTSEHGLVKWKFIQIKSLVEVLDDINGNAVEVYYRFLNNKQATTMLLPIE